VDGNSDGEVDDYVEENVENSTSDSEQEISAISVIVEYVENITQKYVILVSILVVMKWKFIIKNM